MDFYYVCGCGREWFKSKEDIKGQNFIYCSECGEEKDVGELIMDNSDWGLIEMRKILESY